MIIEIGKQGPNIIKKKHRILVKDLISNNFYEENRSRSRHNVEGFFCRCTIFRLAKPAFFRYRFVVRVIYGTAVFIIPELISVGFCYPILELTP